MGSKNLIRYKVLRDIPWLNLMSDRGPIFDEIRWDRQKRDSECPTLVDIIERHGEYAKLKIYQPDGTVVIGWQLPSFTLGLHHQGDFYDGRFNHQE